MSKRPSKAQTHDVVDWDAAITGAAVRAVTQSRSVSRRKRKDPKPAQKLHYLDKSTSGDNPNNVVYSGSVVSSDSLENVGIGDKGSRDFPFSPEDLQFLVNYLGKGMTIDKAMVSAGYAYLPQTTRYDKARKVVKAYAAGTEDKANIFRDVGLSEVEVAQNIKKLIESSRSDQVKLNALALAAKCLRLTDEPEHTHQGVRINIYTGGAAAAQGAAPPERMGVTINTQIVHTDKPLQITK